MPVTSSGLDLRISMAVRALAKWDGQPLHDPVVSCPHRQKAVVSLGGEDGSKNPGIPGLKRPEAEPVAAGRMADVVLSNGVGNDELKGRLEMVPRKRSSDSGLQGKRVPRH